MKANTSCDCALETLVNKPQPFTIVETLDFYDGEISGILRCRDCHTELHTFEMLAWSYNHQNQSYDYRVRIYALAPCQQSDLEEVQALYREKIPLPQHAPQLWEARTQATQRIMERVLPYQFVAAWNLHTGQLVTIQQLNPELLPLAKPLSLWKDEETEGAHHDEFDWFDFLGIPLLK